MIENSFAPENHFKKKKKRSFFQTQKRFAKRGNYGRGSQLTGDMHEYFMNIMKEMNSQRDEENMSILASNVLHEIEGKECEYCCNQIVSRIIENLLPHSTDEAFSQFLENFGKNLRPVFGDTFGSHVLQQTLVVSYKKYQKGMLDDTHKKPNVKFLDYIIKVSNFFFNNLEDFIWNMYSNAVGRTIFNVLSGNPVKSEIKPSNEKFTKPSEEFEVLLKKFAKKVLSWPQFNDLCNQPVNSNFLQSLLIATKEMDENYKIVDRIINLYESNPIDLTDNDNEPITRLMEVVLNVANEEQFKKVYKITFKKNVVNLALSKSGNFAVQKLINCCKSKKIFEKVFAKLKTYMEDVLKVGHSGILLSVVKGCRRLETLQGDCIAMLMRTFHIKDTKEIVPLVSSLTSSENFDSETSQISLHGSLIVEELLNFKKPINIINSILEMPEAKLVKLLSDAKGSHITDAFAKSSSVGEKSRDKLFKKLQGYYVSLATSKHGSRSLDAIWSMINLHSKVLIAEELKAKQSELTADLYGKGFARKIHLENFRRNKEEWIKIQKTSETVEKYFADIIPNKRQKIL